MESKYRVKTVERVVKDVKPVVEVTLDLDETHQIIKFIDKYAYPFASDLDVSTARGLRDFLRKALDEREARAGIRDRI